MPSTYIVVHDSPDGTTYPTDTKEEIALAIEALRANGEESARVYAGDPECPDSYRNGQTLYVPPEHDCDLCTKGANSRRVFHEGVWLDLCSSCRP